MKIRRAMSLHQSVESNHVRRPCCATTYVWISFVTIYTMLQSTRMYNLFPRKTVINNIDKLWHISQNILSY